MSVHLYLFHGRDSIGQDMDNWGSEGATIGPLSYVHTTYGSEVKIRGSRAMLEKFFPSTDIHFHDGHGEHAIQLVGDWSVCGADALRAPVPSPVTPVCDVCGSADLVKDAAATWDRDRQEWSLLSTYDSTTCQHCQREGDDIAQWVPNAEAPSPDSDQAEVGLSSGGAAEAEEEGERGRQA